MRVFGVMGHPISHSLSPIMHTAAFQALGLDAVYAPLDVPPKQLKAVLAGMQVMGVDGCNVTVPLKEHVAKALGPTRLDATAATLQAVNTLARQDGEWTGHNTDVEGFRKALAWELRFDGRNKIMVLLGAGGAARAVAWALAKTNPKQLLVANRTPAHAARLVAWLKRDVPGLAVKAVPFNLRSLSGVLKEADLLVNATSLGLRASDPLPVDASAIHERLSVFDVVYPSKGGTTRLAREARRRGAIAVDGLAMLIYQGAESFRLWWQREPPLEAMRQAVEHAVRKP
jgi:shikimate dehydrogenase